MYLRSMSRGIMKEMELLPLKHTITQLVVSISILSLVFTWSSLSSTSLVYYQNLHYFSSNTCHITMNKNFIFLICNGILVFLTKTSPLARPPFPSDLDDMLRKRIGNDLQEVVEAETYSDKHITLDEEEEDDDYADADDEETKVCEGEQVNVDRGFEHSCEGALQVSITRAGSEDDEIELQDCCLFKEVDDRDQEVIANGGEEDDDEIELRDCCLFKEVDDRDQEIIANGGEEVDEIEKLSDDELNQKFEDFIRRMKEEFRINDYQQNQLIMVN